MATTMLQDQLRSLRAQCVAMLAQLDVLMHAAADAAAIEQAFTGCQHERKTPIPTMDEPTQWMCANPTCSFIGGQRGAPSAGGSNGP